MAPRQLKSTIRAQFMELTLQSQTNATKYLDANDWVLDAALADFYNQEPESDEQVEALFNKYASEENPDLISIDGTLSYLEDLRLDPEDPISLTLAYILESPQTGEFHRKLFVKNWLSLSINTLEGMRKYVVSKQKELDSAVSAFEPFYQFVFEFVRGADSRIKLIPHDEATVYWQMLLDPRFPSLAARLAQWYTFVLELKRNITRDTWNMFFKFLVQVVEKDPELLSFYDETSAWPSVIDEFVEWLQEQQ